jgi:hypothetical protein
LHQLNYGSLVSLDLYFVKIPVTVRIVTFIVLLCVRDHYNEQNLNQQQQVQDSYSPNYCVLLSEFKIHMSHIKIYLALACGQVIVCFFHDVTYGITYHGQCNIYGVESG